MNLAFKDDEIKELNKTDQNKEKKAVAMDINTETQTKIKPNNLNNKISSLFFQVKKYFFYVFSFYKYSSY